MKKFDNYYKALDNLKQIENYTEPYDTVTETGLVALFEICFEQSWKAMKEVLEYHGYDDSKTGSPRMIIKLAFSAGMIKDEETWLSALSSRNDVPHSYNEEIALGIIRRTSELFFKIFTDLKSAIGHSYSSVAGRFLIDNFICL
ncbi:MAG: nucleotidyltransferase substrate binding protein [Ruminococcus sp.]|nr:nucleotidyltransferase substrate binding protein [Ruminococcus sp.]